MNIVGCGYLEAVYKEQKAARQAHGGELSYDALMSMALMRNCVSETLRSAQRRPPNSHGVHALTRRRLCADPPASRLRRPPRCLFSRLYPPLIFLMRKVVVDRVCKHWTVPRGHILAISPREAGRDERVFPDANAFKPERFAEGGQAEGLWSSKSLSDDKKAFSYMAFGTGPHMCLGRRFAYLQLSIIWAVLSDMYARHRGRWMGGKARGALLPTG